MAFDIEKRDARRFHDGLELGNLDIDTLAVLADQADPVLVYLVIQWLRARYQHDPASEGVIGRVVELCQRSPSVPRRMKQGERDPLSEWFEDTYAYRDLDADQFIDIVVEKLES